MSQELPPPPYPDPPDGMNVYLAARYSRLREICGYANDLTSLGFTVTSRWLHGQHTSGEQPDMKNPVNKLLSHHDRTDIIRSNFVIHFTEPEDALYPRGSRHTELGIAYERGKLNYVVGPYENIFHHLDGILRYETWDAFLDHFREVAKFLKSLHIMQALHLSPGGEYDDEYPS
jgi:hypothetical protein